MTRPIQLPPPIALRIVHLTEAEFRVALPHLKELRCRWVARPVGMWLPADGTEERRYQSVPDEERPCVRLVRPVEHCGPPLWRAIVGVNMPVVLCPVLYGPDCGAQVELHLLDMWSSEKP